MWGTQCLGRGCAQVGRWQGIPGGGCLAGGPWRWRYLIGSSHSVACCSSWAAEAPPSTTRKDIWNSRAMNSSGNSVCTSIRREGSSSSSWMALVAWGGEGNRDMVIVSFNSWVLSPGNLNPQRPGRVGPGNPRGRPHQCEPGESREISRMFLF